MRHDFQPDLDAVAGIPAVASILDIICKTTGMGFAAVARVTDARWVACAVHDLIEFGLQPGGELKVETTICHEIRQSREPVVIDHVAADETYRCHHTPALYGFQSYISIPITLADGSFFGTLCAIDPQPRSLNTPATIGMLRLFAELISVHLEAHRRLAASEASLEQEREAAELREQFIAVLGHDLRNPLASVAAGTALLAKLPLGDQPAGIIRLMQASTVRMSGLIDNVLDFARGRLGGGLTLAETNDPSLEQTLRHVIAELGTIWPGRTIKAELHLAEPVHCDRSRIAQLFSNLLGNALSHGAPDHPIRVEAVAADGRFHLAVANAGTPIPHDTIARLFHPFVRGAGAPDQQGLGLGLYIASEIARAHRGTIDVVSNPSETRFTFRMPSRRP